MIPIQLKYLNPIIKKKKNKFWENRQFEIKQKRIGLIKKRIFDPPSHKKKTKKMRRPVKIDRVEAEIQARERARAHTHTHTHTRTHARTHTHAHTHTCAHIHTHTHTSTHTHTHTRTHPHTRAHTYTNTHTSTHTRTHTHIPRAEVILPMRRVTKVPPHKKTNA